MGCLTTRNINGHRHLINFHLCAHIYSDVRLCVSGRGKGINQSVFITFAIIY